MTPTEEEIHKNSVQLEQTLNDFGIRGKIVEVQAGPIVTLYQYKPAPGIRVQKIISLDNDMARTLKVPSIRTYAPVPGHDTVGIELPNAMREIVYFRDVIDSEAWHKADDYDLKIALAKNTFGEPYVVDLARMPHLLVAGATGTGKSVSLNSIVLSLLYQHTPETLKLMMFDPKQVELSIYESIPHLITPVITDAKDAKGALLWLMEEMERRLSLMKELGVINIKSFNKAVAGEKIELDALETDLELDDEVIELGDKLKVDPNTQIKNSTRKQYEPLPLIVVVIDEYADLIMSVREIEEYIIRLAAKSRATGIHLIIATQRPSADIVTGLIKANFPSRIAFKVVSWRDAQTIMDAKGAEKLLGRGDMLFLPPGSAMPKRMHGPFVDEKEVHAVVAWLKDRNVPVYNENIAKMIAQVHLLDINVKANTLNNSAKDEEDGENKRDKIYEDKILPFIVSRGEASISMIQTEFEVGYPRASKYIRWLEKDGIIGPADGAKRRKVLVEPSEIQFRKKDKVNHSSRSVNIEKIDFDAEMADGDSEESLL